MGEKLIKELGWFEELVNENLGCDDVRFLKFNLEWGENRVSDRLVVRKITFSADKT